MSVKLTDKFRIGAQGYSRNIGGLGNGHIVLDWASADYRFKDYFGVRVGKVKSVIGLYNDSQDLEFLHTWALQPQSVYPLDLRGANLSHIGIDLYGTISPPRIGTFSYTVYGGREPKDPYGGRQYSFTSYGVTLNESYGKFRGADLKWNTPVPGLLVGAALVGLPKDFRAKLFGAAEEMFVRAEGRAHLFSAQYSRRGLRLEWERGKLLSLSKITGQHGLGAQPIELAYDTRGWYGAAAYRVKPWLEAGTYHSRFFPNADRQPRFQPLQPPEMRHLFDTAVTARFDVKTHWDIKVEGHFMDGYGDPGSARGFYFPDNSQGLVAKTKLLIIRLGFNY